MGRVILGAALGAILGGVLAGIPNYSEARLDFFHPPVAGHNFHKESVSLASTLRLVGILVGSCSGAIVGALAGAMSALPNSKPIPARFLIVLVVSLGLLTAAALAWSILPAPTRLDPQPRPDEPAMEKAPAGGQDQKK